MLDVQSFLTSQNIRFEEYTHPPVFSTKEADLYCTHVPGLPIKNLFLKDKNTGAFFLFVLPGAKKMDFKKAEALLGSKKITFGNSDELKEQLDVTPGSVSIFCLLNQNAHNVAVYIDEEVYNADLVTFHPNINTSTLAVQKEDFRKFLGLLKNRIQVVEL